MAKTLTIDAAPVMKIALIKNADGSIEVHAEYELRSGGRVLQTQHRHLTDKELKGGRKAAQALFDAVAQDVADAEL